MADKIVSWGGIDSKGTDGMGVTGSLSISGGPITPTSNIARGAYFNNTITSTSNSDVIIGLDINPIFSGNNSDWHTLRLWQPLNEYGDKRPYMSWKYGDQYDVFRMYMDSNWRTNFKNTGQGGQRGFSFSGGNVEITGSTSNSLLVKGSGATSSTTAFQVQNTNASASFTVRDDRSAIFAKELYIDGDLGDGTGSIFLKNSAGDYSNRIGTYGYNTFISTRGTANGIQFAFGIGSGRALNFTGGDPGNISISSAGASFSLSGVNDIVHGSDKVSIESRNYNGGEGVIITRGRSTNLTDPIVTFKYETAEKVRINNSGNVGIGISNPTASLHISGSSGSVLLEVDSNSQQNILYVSGSGTIGIGKPTAYALEVATTSSLLVSATNYLFPAYGTASAAISITPNIYAPLGNRSYYSMYVGNPGVTFSGSFGNYDFRSIYTAGKIDAVGGINAGDSRFYATSNAVSFEGYNPYDGNTGENYGGITFTQRQRIAAGDESGIGAQHINGPRLFIYHKYNSSSTKIIFSLAGSIRSTYFGNGNLSIGNGETDMSARLGVKGSGTTSSTTALLVQNANASASFVVKDNSTAIVGTGTPTTSSIFAVYGNSTTESIDLEVYRDFSAIAGYRTATLRLTTRNTTGNHGGQNIDFRHEGINSSPGAITNARISNSSLDSGNGPSTFTISTTDTAPYGTTLRTKINIDNYGNIQLTDNTDAYVYLGNTYVYGSRTGKVITVAGQPNTGYTGDHLILRGGSPYSSNNTVGGNLILQGGYSTGTAGSNIILQVPIPSGSTGAVLNSTYRTAMFISGSGNIGIGTSTPLASLHVVGNTLLSGSASTSSAALSIYKSGSTVLDIQGSSGQLFSVTDSLSGSLFSVNTVAGLPVIEAFSNNVVNIGKYGNYNLVISGSNTTVTGSLVLNGSNMSSAWTAYTPDWTAASSNPAIGNGTIEGYYKIIGKTCFVRGNIVIGSTTTFGTGEWYVSMPFTASHADGILMTANLLDNGTAWYNATMNGARSGFTTKAPIQYQAVGGTANDVNPTQPFAWATSDRFIWNGSYEIA